MTPSAKAKELVDKYYNSQVEILNKNGTTELCEVEEQIAKQCALIAVDEIIIQIHAYRILLDKTNFLETNAVHVDFWQQVKQEINKI